MNRLAQAASPYLRQHAGNPVDWYPWGEEAFRRAREEDKPIFLSIGYSTCHWCHVMARESFEDREIAALLNAHFVAVKVDREERPDIDSIYMAVCQAFTAAAAGRRRFSSPPTSAPFSPAPISRKPRATARRDSRNCWKSSPTAGKTTAPSCCARRTRRRRRCAPGGRLRRAGGGAAGRGAGAVPRQL